MFNQITTQGLLFILGIISIYICKKNKIIKRSIHLKSYNKEDTANIALTKILLITFLLLIPTTLIFYKQILLAIIIFIINIYLCKIIINILSDVENETTIEIADFINSLIKEFSIQDNLINIMENALQENDGIFVTKMFYPVFKELVKTQDKDIFNKSLQNFNNLWISSLLMILDEYTKNSDRELIINSLNNLYDIMNIKIGTIQETKSKMNIMLFTNNVLLFIGLIGGILDFIINTYGRTFFISTAKGHNFLIIADVLMYVTLILSSKMIKCKV